MACSYQEREKIIGAAYFSSERGAKKGCVIERSN